jgi:hypothetical protein
MTVKSIIDIDIDPEGHFKAFVDRYEKWQAQLSQLGPKWQASSQAAEHMGATVADMTAALAAQTDLLAKAASERHKADREEQATERRRVEAERAVTRAAAARARETKKIAADTKAATLNLLKAGVTFAKWVGFGGLFSVLGAAGGLWGLGRLADSVGESRRSAMGLGTTTGRDQAFGVNFGKLVDAKGNLQRIAEAQNTLADRWAFSPFGISSPQTKDPAELAATMAPIAKRLFEKGGKTAEYADAIGLTKFYSIEELRRLSNTSMAEIEATARAYRGDAAKMSMSDAVAKGEQDLSIALKRSGQNIKNAFVVGIAPLAPKFEKLSEQVSGMITATLRGDKFAKFIGDAGDKLAAFSDYLGSDKFKGDFDRFSGKVVEVADNLVLVSEGLVKALRWLRLIPDPVREKRLDDVATTAVHRAGGAPTPVNVQAERASAMSYWMGRGYSRSAAAGLTATEEAESGFRSTRTGDGGKAYGSFQWHPDRQAAFRRWAGFDIRDPRASRDKQRQFLEYEMTGATGDKAAARAGVMMRRDLSAYDMADSLTRNVERPADVDVQASSRGMLAERIAKMHLKAAVAATSPARGRSAPDVASTVSPLTVTVPGGAGHRTRPAVDITVRDQTGGNVAVSSNMLR